MGKKILILTMGSRGDVEPFLALGPALQEAGHQVTIGTHSVHREQIEAAGLVFSPVAGDPEAMIESRAGQRWIRSGRNPWEFLRGFVVLIRPFLAQALRDSQRAAVNADAIIWTQLSFAGYHLARVYDRPSMMVGLQPLTPTTEFAPAGAARDMPFGPLNYFSHWLSNQLLWLPFRAVVNRWLTEDLALEPYGLISPFFRFRDEGHLSLYAFSPSLVPKPADWGDHIHVTGFFFREEPGTWRPPVELEEFIKAGSAPVYIGFGSMALSDPQDRLQVVRSALDRLGMRAIMLGDPRREPPGPLDTRLFVTGPVPHGWLLPQVRAAVHHGGAGTTAAALRAGIPQLVVPHFADQFFWAGRVTGAGLAPPPIPRQDFDSRVLTERLSRTIADERISLAAARMGARVRAEKGVSAAVGLIEDRLKRPGFQP